jgi:hypothetical protein
MTNAKRNVGIVTAVLALGIVSGYAVRAARADGIPDTNALTYAGTLENTDGSPITGAKELQVLIYDVAVGGSPLCFSEKVNQNVIAGRFDVAMPDSCATAVKGNANAWVEVTVDAKVIGRTKIGAVPFALEAGRAAGATGALKASVDGAAKDIADVEATRGVVTDWAPYVPELYCGGTAVTGMKSAGRWRRVGDSVELAIYGEATAVPPNCATGWRWTLPPGQVVRSKDSGPEADIAGTGIIYTGGGYTVCTSHALQDTNFLSAACTGTSASGGLGQQTTGVMHFDVGSFVQLRSNVPIKGWSSTTP